MVDFNRVLGNAPQEQVTTGTEGRVSVPDVDYLGAAGNLLSVGMDFFESKEKEKDQEIKNTIRKRAIDSLDAATKQGQSPEKIQRMKISTYIDLQREFEGYGEYINKVFKESQPFAKELAEIAKAEEDEAEQSLNELVDDARTALSKGGYIKDMQGLEGEEIIALYDETIGKLQQTITNADLRLEGLQKNVNLTSLEKTEKAKEIMNNALPEYTDVFSGELNGIMTSDKPNEEKAIELTTLVANIEAGLYDRLLPLTSAEDIEQRLKPIRTLADNSLKILRGDFSGVDAITVENENRFIAAAARNKFLKSDATRTQQLTVLNELSNAMKNVDPKIQVGTIGKLADDLVSSTLNNRDFMNPMQGDEKQRKEKIKSFSQLVPFAPDNATSATALVNLASKATNELLVNNNSSSFVDAVNGMADPNFAKLVTNSIGTEKALGNIEEGFQMFEESMFNSSVRQLKAIATEYEVIQQTDGLIKIEANLKNKSDNKVVRRIEVLMNNVIKAKAHLNGSTNYKFYMEQ